MKKKIVSIAACVALIASVVIVSCKKETVQPSDSEVKNDAQNASINIGGITAETDILVMLSLIPSNGQMTVSRSGSPTLTFFIKAQVTLPIGSPAPKEYCRGSGLSFAKCVKSAVDAIGCVKITRDANGDYVASSCS